MKLTKSQIKDAKNFLAFSDHKLQWEFEYGDEAFEHPGQIMDHIQMCVNLEAGRDVIESILLQIEKES